MDFHPIRYAQHLADNGVHPIAAMHHAINVHNLIHGLTNSHNPQQAGPVNINDNHGMLHALVRKLGYH